MKKNKAVALSLSLILGTQSIASISWGQTQSEVSVAQQQVAPGVSATIIKDVSTGRITTAEQIEHRLKNLTIQEREQFLQEARARLTILQRELSAKILEANSAGKTYISSQLKNISDISGVIFLVGGIAGQWMTMLRNSSHTNYSPFQDNIQMQRLAKVVNVVALISGITAVATKVGQLVVDQSISVSKEELALIKNQVALEQRNVEMLLNDLLVSKEISIALDRKQSRSSTQGNVNVTSVLQLDDATKELFRQTLVSNTQGTEVFMKTVKTLPIKSRIALLTDSIRALEMKEMELNVALSDTNLARRYALSGSLADLEYMSYVGAIATGASAVYHYATAQSATAARFAVEGKASYQTKFIRSVRVLAGLTIFQGVAATGAGWVNSYYYLASKEQVEVIKGQVEVLKGQLNTIRENLKNAEEINTKEVTVTNK